MLQEYDVNPARCVVIEDSRIGLLAARAAGMRWVEHLMQSIRHFLPYLMEAGLQPSYGAAHDSGMGGSIE